MGYRLDYVVTLLATLLVTLVGCNSSERQRSGNEVTYSLGDIVQIRQSDGEIRSLVWSMKSHLNDVPPTVSDYYYEVSRPIPIPSIKQSSGFNFNFNAGEISNTFFVNGSLLAGKQFATGNFVSHKKDNNEDIFSQYAGDSAERSFSTYEFAQLWYQVNSGKSFGLVIPYFNNVPSEFYFVSSVTYTSTFEEYNIMSANSRARGKDIRIGSISGGIGIKDDDLRRFYAPVNYLKLPGDLSSAEQAKILEYWYPLQYRLTKLEDAKSIPDKRAIPLVVRSEISFFQRNNTELPSISVKPGKKLIISSITGTWTHDKFSGVEESLKKHGVKDYDFDWFLEYVETRMDEVKQAIRQDKFIGLDKNFETLLMRGLGKNTEDLAIDIRNSGKTYGFVVMEQFWKHIWLPIESRNIGTSRMHGCGEQEATSFANRMVEWGQSWLVPKITELSRNRNPMSRSLLNIPAEEFSRPSLAIANLAVWRRYFGEFEPLRYTPPTLFNYLGPGSLTPPYPNCFPAPGNPFYALVSRSNELYQTVDTLPWTRENNNKADMIFSFGMNDDFTGDNTGQVEIHYYFEDIDTHGN